MNEMFFTKRNETEGVIPTTINPGAKIMSEPKNEGIGMILKQINDLTRACETEVAVIERFMFGREPKRADADEKPTYFYEDLLKHANDLHSLREMLTMLRECILG